MSASFFDRFLEALRTSPLLGLRERLLKERRLLAEAESLANAKKYDAALQVAKKLLISLKDPVAFWQEPFRKWQITPIINRLDPHLVHWRSEIDRYQAALQTAQKVAAQGQLQKSARILREALKSYPHRKASKLLAEVQRLQQGRDWFELGMAAEQIGNIPAAQQHYINVRNEFPHLQAICRRRLAALAIKEQNWTAAIEYSENLPDRLSQQYYAFACYQQKQQQRLAALQKVDRHLKQHNFDQAWQSCIAYIEEIKSDDLIQRILSEYVQPQLSNIPEDWPSRFQLAQSRWLQTGGKSLLQDWAVAAYYRYWSQPEQTTWLQELLPIWATAIINAETATTNTIQQLQDLMPTIIDQIEDEEERSDLQLRWQRETLGIEAMGIPPVSGLRICGVFMTPGFYELFQGQMKPIELPAKMWTTLYTPWWQAVLACQQGNVTQAMLVKPDVTAITPADHLAQQFVAYHEGCYYLGRPGGFPRWREAFPVLEIAKAEILKSPAWIEEIDQLCDEHHHYIWGFKDRQAFAELWFNLLKSDNASRFLTQMAQEEQDEFDVILQPVPTNHRITVLKALRELTGWGLKESKDFLDAAPVKLCNAVNLETAETICRIINNAGGHTTLE
jgi:ribosomal protein L7/L12